MPLWHPYLSVRILVAIHILHDSVRLVKVCDLAALQSAEHLTLSVLSQSCIEESRYAPS